MNNMVESMPGELCGGCPVEVYCDDKQSFRERLSERLYGEGGFGVDVMASMERTSAVEVPPEVKSLYDTIQRMREEDITGLVDKGFDNITEEDLLEAAQASVNNLYNSGMLDNSDLDVIEMLDLQQTRVHKLEIMNQHIEAIDEELSGYDLTTIKSTCKKGVQYAVDESRAMIQQCGSEHLTKQQRTDTQQIF